MIPAEQKWPPSVSERYRQQGYWQNQTMGQLLEELADKYSDKVALVAHKGPLTYSQLNTGADKYAAALQGLGFTAGDRVVVQLPNLSEFVALIFAMFKLGVIPIYALPAHRKVEIEHFINNGFASGYIVADSFAGFDYVALAREVQQNCPRLQHVMVVGQAQEFIDINALMQQSAAAYAAPTIGADQVAFMQISGGSTGLPKLIPRTHNDYIYSFRASAAVAGLTAASVYLVVLPVEHNFPMSSPGFLGALSVGATVVLSLLPNAEHAFMLIEKYRVNQVGLVPPLLLQWLQAADKTEFDLSSLQVIQVGGAKLLAEVAKRVKPTFNATLQQVFGMAEGLVNYTRLDDDEWHIVNTQGRPLSPADEILVVDDNDQPLAVGQSGHLLVKGPYTINNYYNNPAADAKSFTADGYYRTGDIVKLTEDGYLIVQGRAGDHINRTGEKISAEEIEEHLLAHPNIFDAIVVSVPDEYLGERSCAFIVCQGEQPKKVAIKRWIKQRGLAEFKVPDQIVFVDSFATTAVGKVSRKELRRKLQQIQIEKDEQRTV